MLGYRPSFIGFCLVIDWYQLKIEGKGPISSSRLNGQTDRLHHGHTDDRLRPGQRCDEGYLGSQSSLPFLVGLTAPPNGESA